MDSRSRIAVSRASVLVGGGDGGASFRMSLDIAFTTQKIAKEMITKLIIVLMNTPTLHSSRQLRRQADAVVRLHAYSS